MQLDFTPKTMSILFAALLVAASAFAQSRKEKPLQLEDIADFPDTGKFPVGVVYGPKAAFKIRAPEDWVVDNRAGVKQGLPCVLYPGDSTWAEADAVMYAKIANTDTTDRDAFVKAAIDRFKKGNDKFRHERVAEGKTEGGHAYIINDYWHGERPDAPNSQCERVAYIQLPGAVAFIVFTVGSEELHKKHAGRVQDVVKSFTYEPKFINYKAEKPKGKK